MAIMISPKNEYVRKDKYHVDASDMDFILQSSRLALSQFKSSSILSKMANLMVSRTADYCIIEVFNNLKGLLPTATIAKKTPSRIFVYSVNSNDHNYICFFKEFCSFDELTKTRVCHGLENKNLNEIVKDKKNLKILKDIKAGSAMVVPLMFKGKIFGAMTLILTSKKEKFNPREIQVATEFSKRISIVIENARLQSKANENIKLHREAIKKLRAATEKMTNMIESTSDAFVSVDKEWRYTYLNNIAEKFERRRKEQLIGKVMWEVFPDAVNTLFYKKYHEAMKTGKPAEFEEFVDQKWFEIRAYPYHDGLSIYYRDITDKKLLEMRKDEFISMASHELKTPVTSIKIYTEILQKLNLEKKAGEYLEKMSHQIVNITELISDLLDISKIQIGKLTFQKDYFNLAHSVKEIVSTAQKNSGRIESKIKLKENIWGDKDRIEQVVLNLLENALKYSSKDKKVFVNVYKDLKNNAVISVQDFGIGIEKGELSKIFTRFYRVSTKEGKTYPGLGIGLYISNIIAKNHGGKIEVKSELGKGSIFFLKLPMKKPE